MAKAVMKRTIYTHRVEWIQFLGTQRKTGYSTATYQRDSSNTTFPRFSEEPDWYSMGLIDRQIVFEKDILKIKVWDGQWVVVNKDDIIIYLGRLKANEPASFHVIDKVTFLENYERIGKFVTLK